MMVVVVVGIWISGSGHFACWQINWEMAGGAGAGAGSVGRWLLLRWCRWEFDDNVGVVVVVVAVVLPCSGLVTTGLDDDNGVGGVRAWASWLGRLCCGWAARRDMLFNYYLLFNQSNNYFLITIRASPCQADHRLTQSLTPSHSFPPLFPTLTTNSLAPTTRHRLLADTDARRPLLPCLH